MNTATKLLALSTCPDPDTIQLGQRFHLDNTCNRAGFNAQKAAQRGARLSQLLASGGSVAHVPNQKTSYCPLNPEQFTVQPVSSNQEDSAPITGTGLDTVWLVENTASTPVVIAYTNRQGVEVSAMDPTISPPELDPNAILQPGQWMSVLTMEGHVFTAKELLADGTTGRVMLQHRAGLIPIGERMRGEIMDCPLLDQQPMHNNQPDPGFERTPTQVFRPCNTLDVGFRNMAGCPVNGFYVTPGTENVACEESFKFHLGIEENVDHFMKDWTSSTKYEGTFVGHTYHFRLAHDPSVLVQSVTLSPTQVMDCPEEKEAVAIGVGGEAVKLAAGRHEGLGEDQGSNGQDLFAAFASAGSS